MFALKQNRSKINDYYTTLSSLWEEIDSMNTHPPVTTVADDVKDFIKSLDSQKAESGLFQFLNGLDDCYSTLRSQLLMMQPLPTVEVAYASIQQEESQSDILSQAELELAAMFSKTQVEYKISFCTACGVKGHAAEKC